MDLDYHFGEKIVITPRCYKIKLKHEKAIEHHYAMIGTATLKNGYPLYAEGANEKGLCISAQNFPGNAYYHKTTSEGALNLAPYEVILYVLSNFATVADAKKQLKSLRIVDTPFDDETPTTPLHFFIADENESITLEPTKNGTKIYKNPVGILTNNPPFEKHLEALENYAHLIPKIPQKNATSLGLDLQGLPGDFSSSSRFIRLSILKKYMQEPQNKDATLSAVFRLMSAVSIPKGLVKAKGADEHYTTYTCVINATKGIYYLSTPDTIEIKRAYLNGEALNLSEPQIVAQ